MSQVPDTAPLREATRAGVTAYRADRPLERWARETAELLLARDLPRRWAHTQGVARQARRVARALPPAERPVLVASAWLHDVGYAADAVHSGLHQLDGARFLSALRVPPRVCALVARHSGASSVATVVGLADELAEFADERGAVRDALWYSDMTTGPDGAAVSFDERMAELRARRGAADPAVRALDGNQVERAAAVHRTEEVLREWRPSVEPVADGPHHIGWRQ